MGQQSRTVADLLPNLSHVSTRKNLQVLLQGTVLEGPLVQRIVGSSAEQNVILHRGILDPRLLWYICHPALERGSYFRFHDDKPHEW